MMNDRDNQRNPKSVAPTRTAFCIWRLAAAVLMSLCMCGCGETETADYSAFEPVDIKQILSDRQAYAGRDVVIDGFVLGLELSRSADDREIWILVLGDQPALDGNGNRLIFADVPYKIRAGEDGFNRDILKRCHAVCSQLREAGRSIRIYGTYQPENVFHHYNSGVDLQMSAIEINGTIINTDFEDHGAIREKTPTVMRSIYKGSRRVARLMKIAI